MGILDLGRYKGIVFAITGFLVFIAIILAVNHGKAGQFSDNVAGVKFLASSSEQPRAVYDAGVELAAAPEERAEDRRAARSAAQSREVVRQRAQRPRERRHDHRQRRRRLRRCRRSPPTKRRARSPTARKLWNAYKAKLDPVLRFSGSPYAAPDAPAPAAKVASLETAPVPLSPRGRRLQAALQDLNTYGATSHAQLRNVMVDLTAQVESREPRPLRHAAHHAGRRHGRRPAAARRDLLLLRAQPAQGRSRLEPRSARKPRTFCAR